MAWIHLVVVLALFQYLMFGVLVGRARGKYDVKAPATTGHEVFERYYRVHMNTLELLVVFIPVLWIAALYWNPSWMAAIGGMYLVGRFFYLRAYTRDPASRELGFILSIVPVVALLIAALAGVLMSYTSNPV